jgi:xanthine dehydrogenase YagS FAD-binding subunit
MNSFTLISARSVPEAAAEAARPKTVVKAGGVDLVDRMKEGLDAPERVVSIARISGLDRIEAGPPAHLGALATLGALASNEGLRRHYPALAAAAGEAATPQIRHMATLGGNLCQRPRCWYYRLAEFDCRKKGGSDCFALEGENRFHAIFDTERICVCVHPSATGAALLAYGATLHTVSRKGRRDIAIEDFFVGPDPDPTRENRLGPGEIIESVSLRAPSSETRSAYRKLKEKESFDWPLVEVCVVLRLSGGAILDPRVVLGHVAQVPWRSKEAEAVLAGAKPSPELYRKASEAAVSAARPLSQNAYKVRLARVALERSLRDAVT